MRRLLGIVIVLVAALSAYADEPVDTLVVKQDTL